MSKPLSETSPKLSKEMEDKLSQLDREGITQTIIGILFISGGWMVFIYENNFGLPLIILGATIYAITEFKQKNNRTKEVRNDKK